MAMCIQDLQIDLPDASPWKGPGNDQVWKWHSGLLNPVLLVSGCFIWSTLQTVPLWLFREVLGKNWHRPVFRWGGSKQTSDQHRPGEIHTSQRWEKIHKGSLQCFQLWQLHLGGKMQVWPQVQGVWQNGTLQIGVQKQQETRWPGQWSRERIKYSHCLFICSGAWEQGPDKLSQLQYILHHWVSSWKKSNIPKIRLRAYHSGVHAWIQNHYKGEWKQVILANHPSAMTCSSVVLQKLNKEVEAGRLASLFLKIPQNGFFTNPLGLVPKTNELGLDLPEMFPNDKSSYRLITDLKRSGVNAGIPPLRCVCKQEKVATWQNWI